MVIGSAIGVSSSSSVSVSLSDSSNGRCFSQTSLALTLAMSIALFAYIAWLFIVLLWKLQVVAFFFCFGQLLLCL